MNKITNLAIAVSGAIAILVSGVALPAFAATSVGLGVSAVGITTTTGIRPTGTRTGTGTTAGGITTLKKLPPIIVKTQTNADLEITRRITALNALSTRLNNEVKLSAGEKTTFSAAIQAQITIMNNLQAKITADANADATSSLKADIASITKTYRVFALIIPQGSIEAAVDRILTIVNTMTDLSTKFQARIAAAPTTANVTGAQAALADMNAKIADATAQANAANNEVVSLQPDNGVSAVMQSNTAALKDARSKIQAAQQDLTAAQKDAVTIVKDLNIKVDASATVVATTTAGGVQ